MLDLSQFENSWTQREKELLNESRRLQENNRELCEFMRDDLAGYVRDEITEWLGKYGESFRPHYLAMYRADLAKIDALIAKNQGA